MAEPKEMITPMLQAMRAEIAGRFDKVDQRLEALEVGQKSIRTALAGELVINRMTIGAFDERITTLESQIEELQGQK